MRLDLVAHACILSTKEAESRGWHWFWSRGWHWFWTKSGLQSKVLSQNQNRNIFKATTKTHMKVGKLIITDNKRKQSCNSWSLGDPGAPLLMSLWVVTWLALTVNLTPPRIVCEKSAWYVVMSVGDCWLSIGVQGHSWLWAALFPRQVVLNYMRKLAGHLPTLQATNNIHNGSWNISLDVKLVSLSEGMPCEIASKSDFKLLLQWWTVTWNCNPNKYYLP